MVDVRKDWEEGRKGGLVLSFHDRTLVSDRCLVWLYHILCREYGDSVHLADAKRWCFSLYREVVE